MLPENFNELYYDVAKCYPSEFTITLEKDSVPVIETKDRSDPMIPEHVYVPIGEVKGIMSASDALRKVAESSQHYGRKEYNTMYKTEKERNPYPKCTGIIQRGRATIVTWDDGTKTTIVAEESIKANDHMMFEAFCIAFTKKMLGSTTNILKTIEANDTDAINKRKKEFEEQIKKNMREANKRAEKIAFERAVQAKMEDERVREEAIRRISEKDFMAKKFEG